MKDRRPLLGELLAGCITRLRKAGVASARTDCGWLVAAVLDCARLELHRLQTLPVPEQAERQIMAGIERLASAEPLAYVLGNTEFYGRRFFCDHRALIPRPETEQLTGLVLADSALWKKSRPRIVEVGFGTGCLIATLAIERPRGRYAGTDISQEALLLARLNLRRHRVLSRVRLVARDLLSDWRPASLSAVVSNPPYVPTGQWQRLERSVRAFEPRLALDGGGNGLAVIRRLLPQAYRALQPAGPLNLEIGADQGAAVLALAAAAGFRNAETRADYSGRTRFLIARR